MRKFLMLLNFNSISSLVLSLSFYIDKLITLAEGTHRMVANTHEEKAQWFYDFKTNIDRRQRKQVKN